MIRCEPQAYLRNGGTLAELERSLGIAAKRHKDLPRLVMLKYDQIESDFSSTIVRQCRGLILDEDLDWAIVARPFDKFFNLGEGFAAKIDWRTASVLEKLDGSLMILYYHAGKWRVATSGTPDASGEVTPYGVTFMDLFWDIWTSKRYLLPSVLHQNHTFMFELTSPYNRIVVKHGASNLRLIGVRNNISGYESPLRNFPNWDVVREFPKPSSMEEVIKLFDEMKPTEQEGFVVVDHEYNRVKIKHPGYVALHHLRSSISPKNILEIVRRSESPEVLASFPDWETALERVQARFDGLVMALEQKWDEIKYVVPRKEFAAQARTCPWPDAMFALYDERVPTIRTYLKNEIHIDRLAKILAIDEVLEDLVIV